MRSEEEIRKIWRWLKDYELGFTTGGVFVGDEELYGPEVDGAFKFAQWVLNDKGEE
jgi:hypothetical protein